jgi:hypothetical protein
MKKALMVAILLSTLLTPLLAEAQAPTPPDVPTLGPVIICSAGDSGNFVKITSLENQTTYPNPIQLNFNTQQITLLGQFYNIGYSIDGGTVTSVTNSVSRSIDNSGLEEGYYKSKAIGNLILPTLSEGFHRINVYVGWQYGANHPEWGRFDVFAYATVEFTVGNPASASPAPTQTPTTSSTPSPTFSPTPILPTASSAATSTQVSSNYPLNQMLLITMAIVIAIVAVASLSLVHFKRHKSSPILVKKP